MKMAQNRFRLFIGIMGILGVIVLINSFIINPAPPAEDTLDQLIAFGNAHKNAILTGAWMQTLGTMLLALFAFAIVHLSGAANRFSGWATFFGAILLMVVSVIEVNFYLNSLTSTRETIEANIDLIKSTQHLFSMVGAPALFLSLGTVILGAKTLPRPFGYVALFIGAAFAILGVVALYGQFQYLVDYLAMGQGFWWLLAAIVLLVRKRGEQKSVHGYQSA